MGIIRISDCEIEIVDRKAKNKYKHLARLFIYIDQGNRVHIYSSYKDHVAHHSFTKGSLLAKNINKEKLRRFLEEDKNPSRRY